VQEYVAIEIRLKYDMLLLSFLWLNRLKNGTVIAYWSTRIDGMSVC
jgi:hypothetical protein